jgi:hypothetical protein
MATFEEKRTSAAAHARRTVDEVLQIAQAEHASATVLGGSKPHVRISKQVTEGDDAYFRAMLSGIEYATRGHFAQGHESAGYTEWTLRWRLIDVSVRAEKGGA